jgi:hypothetical protein
MTLLDMGAIGLATWRLSSLVVNEEGPWGIFLRLRCRLGISHEDGIPCAWPDGLAALFSCLWCMSVWMAGLSYLVWWLSPVPVYILAASALCVLFQSAIDWRQHGRT